MEKVETEEGAQEWRGVEEYNATIAGCDRSCELRAGNLGAVYADLGEGVVERQDGMVERRKARGELERG